MKIKKLCNRLIKNIKIAVVSDNLRRKLLFYFLNAALSLTSFIMTTINIFTKEHILMFATLLFAVLCLLNIILLYFSKIPLRLMCKHCRFCRWGGEEFLLIMQCEHDAAVIAEKIRKEVENTPIDYNGKTIHATISVGVCIIGDISGITVHNAIEQADKAMYQSKNSGKNRVTVKTVN